MIKTTVIHVEFCKNFKIRAKLMFWYTSNNPGQKGDHDN